MLKVIGPLLANATTRISINQDNLKEMDLVRSIRQECQFVSTLYAMVI